MKVSRQSSSSSSGPRYDLAINPPYRINYRAKRAGKRVSATKRRITFQFGFSDARAIAAGRTEVDCRGEEHEVVLVWSHVSGKRELFMDGRQVHLSKAGRGNAHFEYSWTIRGGHILKIVAHGAHAATGSYDRQFDLELDGMSYFAFAKIYQLGRGRSSPKREAPGARAYSYHGLAYEARDDAEYDEEDAPLNSYDSTENHPPVSAVQVDNSGTVDLFDASPSPMTYKSSSTVSSVHALPALATSSHSGLTYTASMSSSSVDEFAPVEAPAVPKTFDAISSQILTAYGGASPAPAPVDAPSSSRALVPVTEEQMDPVAKSLRNLVNLDDITTGPLRPLQAPKEMDNRRKSEINWALKGRAPTLAEMRDAQSSPKNLEVMRAPPQVPQSAQQPMQQTAYGQGYGQEYGQAYHPMHQQVMSAYGVAASGTAAAPSYGYGAPIATPGAGYAPTY
ncbi:hypothetical protein ACHAWF_014782 [Thalassiosira exigua]